MLEPSRAYSSPVMHTIYTKHPLSNTRLYTTCYNRIHVIDGMVIVAIVHTLPPSELDKPEYFPPAPVAIVFPNVVSAASSVITVFKYCCCDLVPVQPPLHSVPVPHLQPPVSECMNRNKGAVFTQSYGQSRERRSTIAYQ